jgi:hypothetical protein
MRVPKNLLSYLLLASLLPLLTACPGTRTGNPEEGETTPPAGIVVTGSSQPATVAWAPLQRLWDAFVKTAWALPPPALEDSQGSAITLSQAWIVLDEFEFDVEEAGDGQEDIELRGPFFVDLLDETPASLGNLNLAEVGYRRVKFKLFVAEPGTLDPEVPAPLEGNSVLIVAQVAGKDFNVEIPEDTDFEVAGPNAVVPKSGTDLLITVKVADLFKDIDLSAVTDGDVIDGETKIDAVNPCPNIDAAADDLYTCFRKGLEHASDLGRDDDGDGDLDDDEDSVRDGD